MSLNSNFGKWPVSMGDLQKAKRRMEFFFSAIIFLLALLAFALAFEGSAEAASSRQKVIDFEDELVEGINKKPFDSLNQISDQGKKRGKPHLYRKRAGFSSEIEESLNEMRWL